MNRALKYVLMSVLLFALLLGMATAAIADNEEAQIGKTLFTTLKEAVASANATSGGATITLLEDITLGEKLTISGNVTISGEKTITRASSYTGTLFTVNAGATLTLDGGLIVDGGNEYGFKQDIYDADLAAMQSIPTADAEKYFEPQEGAPVATAFMIVLTKGSASAPGATVNLNNVTVKNNYSKNSGIVSAPQYTTTNLKGAKITHVASTQGNGVVVNASGAGIKVNIEEGTVIDGNHVGGNHGIFKVYSGTVLTMNGGIIKNTTGWNSNGTVAGMYGGTFIMNGGEICYNTSVYGPSNGRNASIYLHANSVMEMHGGLIDNNSGRSRGGIDSSKESSKLTITGGEVRDNISLAGNVTPDVGGTVGTWAVNGGIFTTDVSPYTNIEPAVKFDDGTDALYAVGNTYIDEAKKRFDSAIQDGTLTVTILSGQVDVGELPEDVNIFVEEGSGATIIIVDEDGNKQEFDVIGSFVWIDLVMMDKNDNPYNNDLVYSGSGDVILKSNDRFDYFVQASLYHHAVSGDEPVDTVTKDEPVSNMMKARSGSIEVTILESAIKELGYGKYTLEIQSGQGTVVGEFIYNEPVGLPQTGDNSNPLFFAALLALSGAGMMLLKKRGMSR